MRNQRSFCADADLAFADEKPRLRVSGGERVPANGPCLVVCNHYSRPGFDAWWIAFGISAVVARFRSPDANREIQWVMTNALTFPESCWRARMLTPLTRWALPRVGAVYGFISMPAMPPAPEEVQARAAAVLRTVRLARSGASSGVMVGLAPEGMDTEGGFGQAQEGAGEFIALLVKAGLVVLPVGVSELGGALQLSFGEVFSPDIPQDRSQIDAAVSGQVMARIQQLIGL